MITAEGYGARHALFHDLSCDMQISRLRNPRFHHPDCESSRWETQYHRDDSFSMAKKGLVRRDRQAHEGIRSAAWEGVGDRANDIVQLGITAWNFGPSSEIG